MNLPNKLTLTRAILILPMVALLTLSGGREALRWVALAIYIIAAVTDFFDGYIARKRQLVTNFGKFLDPVADKMLVLSAMICLCASGDCPAWICVLVAFRELAVDGLRLIACEQGKVIAAGPLGKIKTNVQLVTAGYCMARFDRFLPGGEIIRWVLLIATAVMTLLSGADYFIRNRELIRIK